MHILRHGRLHQRDHQCGKAGQEANKMLRCDHEEGSFHPDSGELSSEVTIVEVCLDAHTQIGALMSEQP